MGVIKTRGPKQNRSNIFILGKIEFSPEEEPSAVSKYSLICENEKHRHWARFAWAFGLLCGSPVNGYLADRFGRRSQILLCSLIVLVFGESKPPLMIQFHLQVGHNWVNNEKPKFIVFINIQNLRFRFYIVDVLWTRLCYRFYKTKMSMFFTVNLCLILVKVSDTSTTNL